MALIKCKECGNEVSNKAKSCPNCGVKIKRSSVLKIFGYIFLALIILPILVATFSGNSGSSSISSSSPTKVEPQSTPVKEYSEIRVCAPNASERIEKLPNGSIITGIPAKYVCSGPSISYKAETEGISEDQNLYVLEEQNGWIKFRITAENVGWSAWVPKEKTISLDELRQLREAKFGKAPDQSTLDKSVHCVKDYLKKIANEPDSIKFVSWSNIFYNDNDGWIVRCEYRNKNAFGAYVLNVNWFVIQNGIVIRMEDGSRYGDN